MARNLPKQLQNGLVMWLDGAGKDLSGNGNNGTLTNSPTKVRRLQNDGLTYNGTNQYTLIANNAALKPTNTTPVYVSFWFKSSQVPAVYGPLLTLGYEDGSSANSSGFIAIQNNGTLRISGNGTNVIDTTIAYNDGKFHNVYCVFGATSSIYVDGILRVTGAVTFNSGVSTFAPSLGAIVYGTTPRYYSGDIINPMIYNRALSVKEVEMLFVSLYIK